MQVRCLERPVDPYGAITQGQAADMTIRPDMNKYEAEHAYGLDPWHPLVHLALAGFEEGSPGVTEPKTGLRCSVLWTALTPRM